MTALCNPPRTFALLLILVVLTNPTLAAPGDVAASFDSPCKYPAGMATDGSDLYVLDWRQATIYQIDATDGAVKNTWPAPTLKPQGLAYGDGMLYISDDQSGQVYTFNPLNGMVENTFEAPGKHPAGLAYVDGALFLLERGSHLIYKVLPSDGTILGYFDPPNSSCSCLTYDGEYLWVANRVKNELYMIEPESGMVLNILEAPGPYAAGLAWLDGYLWNVDFQTRKVYKLNIHSAQKYRLTDTRAARVEYYWVLYNYGPNEVRDLRVNLAIPEQLNRQELLSELDYSVQPTKFDSDQWNQPCAIFDLGEVPAGDRKSCGYQVDVKISAIRYLIDPSQTGTLADIPADIRATYTVDGSRYRIDSPFIQKTVQEVVGQEQNTYWIARKVFNYLIKNVNYEMIGGWDVPEVILKRGTGSCSEYTFAFIALCRAAGLPARYQGSVVVRGDDASVDDAFHRWAEVYLPNYGWIPIDPSGGDRKDPADQARAIGQLSNRFLITTRSGGGSEYLDWNYNSFYKYKTTGYCNIKVEYFAFWEPLQATDNKPAMNKAATPETCRPQP